MLRSHLHVALRLRRIAVETAKRNLAVAIDAELAANAALTRASRALSQEMTLATALTADDAMSEAYVAWLPRGRAAKSAAKDQAARSAADAAHARAVLGAARSAEAAVETLMQRLSDAALAQAKRTDQTATDEAAARQRITET